MINKVWFALLLIGILYGFGKGAYRTLTAPATPSAATQPASDQTAPPAPSHPLRDTGQHLTDAAFGAAQTAVEQCIILIGMMALWLGMLNIAREAGMVEAFASAMRPLTRWLFPGVPQGHPAHGAMLMNMSANMLGLGNAATPFGLKAMRDLQSLNSARETATNAMVTFLAINTSSVTIVPFTTIALRVANESKKAAAPLAGMILATAVSTAVAIFTCRVLSRLPRYRVSRPARAESADAKQMGD